jgi:RNA 3'-terminal phosphate cyclase (ATP)
MAAAELGDADVQGAQVGSRDLTFRPATYSARDLSFDIGTAGSAALVLQTLHLPLALRAEQPVRLTLDGGTFNTHAPSFPFLETTWRGQLAALGAPVMLAMPTAGFYPAGGGQLDAWIEPAQLRPLRLVTRGPLVAIRGVAGVARLRSEIAMRMCDTAARRLAGALEAIEIDLSLTEWNARSPGAAIALAAEFEGLDVPATFVGLGEKGKPAEAVAVEAVDELLAHANVPGAAVDPHTADQILIPLALAAGESEFTVSAVTEHLRTNAQTIRAFLSRKILIEDPTDAQPGRVIVA